MKMTKLYGFKIGDTPLVKSLELSKRYGCNVLIKDESKNQVSGTFKDRRNSFILMLDDKIKEPVYYVQISSGNSGISMGRLCRAYEKLTRKKRIAVNIVDNNISEEIKNKLKKLGVIIEVDLQKEIISNDALIGIAREHLQNKNAIIKLVERINEDENEYESIIGEIGEIVEKCKKEKIELKYIFCPVGEGELMAKLIWAINKRKLNIKVIGVTIRENVFASEKLFDSSILKSIADKLICPYSNFKKILLDLCNQYGHEIIIVEEKEILEEIGVLKEAEINAEPSSAVAFAGVKKYSKNFNFNDEVIVINTGNGK